jgi:hypothetical protein
LSAGSIARAAELIARARAAGFVHGDSSVPARVLRGEEGGARRRAWSTEIAPADLAAIAREDRLDPHTTEEAA